MVKPHTVTTPDKTEKKVRVIDSYWTFAVAIATLGPFALPLLWRNPRVSSRHKMLVSVAVIVLTIALVWVSWSSFKEGYKQYEEMKKLFEQQQSL